MPPQTSGSMGSGGSPRTRQVLGAVLALALIVAVAAVFLSKRDPSEFRDRATLPSCGSVEEAVDGSLPPDAIACFDAALGGTRGAELRVVSYSVEGDPIFSYYRALTGGGVEVLIDNTDDDYGSGGWLRRSCPRPSSLRALGDCFSATL